MDLPRRDWILAAAALAAATAPPARAQPPADTPYYGLITEMLIRPGQRDAFTRILLAATAAMPGCLSYVVAADTQNPDAIWITEVWDSKASHAASLKIPSVLAAMKKAGPMIASVRSRAETLPLGGASLPHT